LLDFGTTFAFLEVVGNGYFIRGHKKVVMLPSKSFAQTYLVKILIKDWHKINLKVAKLFYRDGFVKWREEYIGAEN
jgi:hypothetical protein